MGFAAILAVLDAIGKVAGAINGIYTLVKNADELFNGKSDWDQVRAIVSTQIQSRNQILQVSEQILDAVAQLDRRIFLERMADKLADSDQAVLALDTWKRTGNQNQSSDALNVSAGALADLLRYSSNGVYPKEALVFPLVEILLIRLVVLKEADPEFARSPVARVPIEDSIEMIRSTADGIEAAIEQANTIRESSEVRNRVRFRPADEGGGRETVKVFRLSVSYRNLDGTVTFERYGEFEPEDGDPDDILADAMAGATAARSRGLALDLERARLTVLREAADVAERSLLVAEARWVTSLFFQREPTDLEAAVFLARRQRADFEEVASAFVERTAGGQESLRVMAAQLRGDPSPEGPSQDAPGVPSRREPDEPS